MESTYLMLAQGYMPIVVMLAVAAAFVGAMLGLSLLLGPGRKGAIKGIPYESGVDPIGSARGKFKARFYMVALLFLVFDVELIFFYPWVLVFHASRSGAEPAANSGMYLAAMLIFTGLLLVAFAYEWLKGGFDWH